MADHDDAPAPGAWPDASLLPDPAASNREWARFYRDHCGWVVLPTASPADVMSYAIALHTEALSDFAVDHPGEDVPEETSLAYWDHARELADATAGRPIGHFYNAWLKSTGNHPAKVTTASDITDEMLDLAWLPLEHSRGPRAHADQRGIAILPNRSERGFPVCLVDVDVGHDDSPPGDVDGPWGWQLPGPKASTPKGGLHTFLIATGKETASADLGPGIDVVAGGGTMIPVPAGSATPGRTWLRWDTPVLAPDALRKRGRKKAPPPRVGERQPGDDDEGEGYVAALMLAPVGDGERNRVAGAIIGLLARPGACPDDFVTACLETLVEEMAGREIAYAAATAEQARWRHALTRGPRDAEFAAEVLETWYEVRNTASKRWKTTPRKFALSVWKVCDRREGGQAGAEDLGVGPALSAAPPGWLSAPLTLATPLPPRPMLTAAPPVGDGEMTERERFIFDGPAQDGAGGTEGAGDETPANAPAAPPSPAQVAAEAAKANARWRGGIDPRTYVHSLSEVYTDADLQADLEREPIQVGEVMPAVDFVSGQYLFKDPERLTAPCFHGWGEPLNHALGGLKAGDFVVVGASGAGAGKTWFACWLANGLAMQTAWRLLGARGYDQAPIVLPIWVTEMMSKSDLYLRLAGAHLGFDVAAITRGRQAHEAPGIIAMAQKYSMSPHEVVRCARESERLHGTSEYSPMGFARHHVIKHVRLSKLPRRTRQAGVVVDHRSGPMLVDHLADAVDCYREDFAAAAGVTIDKVFPLVIIDPTQRFVSGDSEKRAIDEFIGAAAHVLCNELDAAVIATSDTTKAAATDIKVVDFLGMDPKALEARVLAGSYAIVHNATHCLLLQAEHPAEGGLRSRQWARVTKNRSGGPADVAFPFGWERHLGRYLPEAPEALAGFAQAHGDSNGGRNGAGRHRASDNAPAGPPLGAMPPGLRLPPLRRGYAPNSERD